MKKHSKFLKSLLAIVIAILMVGSVIPTVAFASDDADLGLIEEEASIGAILSSLEAFLQNIRDFFQQIMDFFREYLASEAPPVIDSEL